MKNAHLNHRGHNRRVLTDAQENLIVSSIDNSNTAQISVSYKDVRIQARQLYKDTHPHVLRDITNFKASNGFMRCLKKRHSLPTRVLNSFQKFQKKQYKKESTVSKFIS